jgi:Helix-turn-helix domain
MTAVVEGMRPAQRDQLAFVQVPSALLRSGIPSDELHVYLILCDFAGKKSVCWPSDRTIGGFIGRSPDTVSRILSRLEFRGLISRTRVETNDENPTGRLIITHRRAGTAPVRQGAGHGCPTPPANQPNRGAAPVRHELNSPEEKKQDAGGGDVPDETGSPPPAQEELQALWDDLPDDEREAILAAVKADNPGLVRFPKLLHPVCLDRLVGQTVPLRIYQETGT